MNGKLPALDYQKKWLWGALGYALFCVLYLLTGNLHLTTPVMLRPESIDDLIPFVAWTIWIYHSQFFFLLFNVYLIKRGENLQRVYYAMALASLLSFCIFIIYPTTLPRHLSIADGLTAKAFALLYSIDSPSNCLPSLHVSLAWLTALGVWKERKILGGLAIVWAIAITLSTMTTKQHYFVDVANGVVLAMFCRALMSKFA